MGVQCHLLYKKMPALPLHPHMSEQQVKQCPLNLKFGLVKTSRWACQHPMQMNYWPTHLYPPGCTLAGNAAAVRQRWGIRWQLLCADLHGVKTLWWGHAIQLAAASAFIPLLCLPARVLPTKFGLVNASRWAISPSVDDDTMPT
jgi:hypothetical protein